MNRGHRAVTATSSLDKQAVVRGNWSSPTPVLYNGLTNVIEVGAMHRPHGMRSLVPSW